MGNTKLQNNKATRANITVSYNHVMENELEFAKIDEEEFSEEIQVDQLGSNVDIEADSSVE